MMTSSNVTSTTTPSVMFPNSTTFPAYLIAWRSQKMAYYKYGIFSLIMLVSLLGNTIVVVTISMTKRLQKVTNYFLFNMAIADILVTVTCMPINLASWVDHTVMLGQLTCKAMPFIQGTSVCCAIYTLTAMAIDRYTVILFPFKGRINKQQCLIILFFIWSAAMLTVSPSLFVYRVGEYSPGERRCDEYGWSRKNAIEFTYTLVTLTYFLPLVILFFIYLRIFIFLWYREIPGIADMPSCIRARMKKKFLRRKKLVQMLIMVVITFLLCHLPQNVMNLLWYGGDEVGWSPPLYIEIIAFHSEIALYLNAALNPIVYGFLHGRIKEASFSIFLWIFCCKKPSKTQYDPTRSTKMSHASSNQFSTKYKYSIVDTSQKRETKN